MICIEREIIDRLTSCDEFLFANATLSLHVAKLLEPALTAALKRGAVGAFVVGLDLGTTEPAALERLLALSVEYPDQFRCSVFQLR